MWKGCLWLTGRVTGECGRIGELTQSRSQSAKGDHASDSWNAQSHSQTYSHTSAPLALHFVSTTRGFMPPHSSMALRCHPTIVRQSFCENAVMAGLPVEDEKICAQLLTGGKRRPSRISPDRTGPCVSAGDPQGLLRRTPHMYQMYNDTGRSTYEYSGERRATLRTYDAE